MTNTLQLVLLLLASSVIVVALFRTLQLPALLGYLLVGVLVGPHALQWVPESSEARHLAEFGVVFLMFSIGLEFSLARLYQMRRLVFGLGLAQVALTLAGGTLASILLGFGWKAGLVLGGALAMSSTAIVVRMLAERRQLESAHGRETVGVLLFQDLAVVPLLVIIPALAGGDDQELAQALGGAILKAGLILGALLFVGQKLMRSLFHAIARRRSHELFILNILLVTLGLSWLTELAGLSLALGAFLAGMLIGETEYRHQVDEDIKPFREVLLGLFFVTIGMQLDLAAVGANFPLVLFLSAVPLLFKFVLVVALSCGFGAPSGTAIRTALCLAQAGEFGLVILSLGVSRGIVENELGQIATAAMLISMLAAPVMIQFSDRLAMRWAQGEWVERSLELHRIAVQTLGFDRHVILCGYGRNGQRLGHLLDQAGVRYVALDLDPERVREAAAAGEPVTYGDSASREALMAAGVLRASAMIITFADTQASLRILAHARELNPAMPVVVRTFDDTDLDRLLAAGAAEVVPESFESSLMLGSHTLVLLGVPLRRVLRQIQQVRDQRYGLLRGFFHGDSDEPDDRDDPRELRLHSVVLAPGSYAVGRALGTLSLDDTGVSVTLLRRRDARIPAPEPSTRLVEGDVVVVLGSLPAVESAEIRLIQGG